MNSFEYATPSSVEEAVSLLSEKWGETEVLAGGTDLVTSLKQGITSPKRLVSLKNVGLTDIVSDGKTLKIGAMTPIGELVSNDLVEENFPALSTAAENIASPQLLNVGTVGGDLCQRPRCWYYRNGHGLLAQRDGKSLVTDGDNRYHAIFGNSGAAKFVSASSLGPALVALRATIRTTTREIPADDFFTTPKSEGERETALEPNEIVTGIEIPMTGYRNATYEVRHRKGLDWPYATASVAFNGEGGKAGDDVRIVLGHVAPIPWLAKEAARYLVGRPISGNIAQACGGDATRRATPLSRNAYKVKMTTTAVKRAVLIAAGLSAQG